MALVKWDGQAVLWDGQAVTWGGEVNTANVVQHTATLGQMVAEGAPIASLCEVFLSGQKQDEVPIVDGSVTYDATQRVWRTCDVTLAGPIPMSKDDLLAPAGATLRLWRGVYDWTGQKILQPLGVYAFEESSVSRQDRLVSVPGYDMWQVISDARWEEPYEIARGTNIKDAIEDAVRSRLPAHLWQDPNIQSATTHTGQHVWGEERSNDPAEDIKGLADDHGLLVYFDRLNRLTMVPIPDPDDAPIAANFTVGESPLLLDTSKTLHGRPENVVIVTWEDDSDSAPVTGIAEDTETGSASNVSLYRKPRFSAINLEGPMTETELNRIARRKLNRRIGLAEQVGLTTVADPGRDVWQVIQAYDAELGIDARYLVDRLTIPLRAGESSVDTRRRTL